MLRTFYALLLLLFHSDLGVSGGGTAPTTSGDAQTGSEPGKTTPSAQPTGEAPAPPSGDERKFTQVELDDAVKRRLAEERGREERRVAEAKRKSDEEAAVKNGEWQTLAQQRADELAARGTEIEQLKAQAKQAERYAARLNAQIDGEIATWPAEVTALDPGKADPDARAAWVEKGRALALKLGLKPQAPATEAGKGSGAPPADKPAPQGQPAQGQRFRFQEPGDVSW